MTSRKSPGAPRRTARRATPEPARALDRGSWLDAATDAVAEGGFGAARILTLARRLGVTRGSFYWHFRNHDDFLRALLERWRDGELRALAAWRLDTGDAKADVRGAVHLLLTEMARDAKALRVELAVQDFARRNALAAAVSVDVNRARMRQGRAMVEALTGDADRAHALTLLLYACITGARLMLAASPRNAKTDAMAESLDRIIGEALIASNDARAARNTPCRRRP
jgi:AcrR family transcriptional regulator